MASADGTATGARRGGEAVGALGDKLGEGGRERREGGDWRTRWRGGAGGGLVEVLSLSSRTPRRWPEVSSRCLTHSCGIRQGSEPPSSADAQQDAAVTAPPARGRDALLRTAPMGRTSRAAPVIFTLGVATVQSAMLQPPVRAAVAAAGSRVVHRSFGGVSGHAVGCECASCMPAHGPRCACTACAANHRVGCACPACAATSPGCDPKCFACTGLAP